MNKKLSHVKNVYEMKSVEEIDYNAINNSISRAPRWNNNITRARAAPRRANKLFRAIIFNPAHANPSQKGP